MGQNIANKVQANIKALIPSTDSLIDKLSIPTSNDDKTALTEAIKIDYEIERAKPAQPVTSTSLKGGYFTLYLFYFFGNKKSIKLKRKEEIYF